MKPIKILSRIENGKMKRNRKLMIEGLKIFEGKEIEITIARKYPKRSIPENKYYWSVVVEYWRELIKEEWGDHLSSNEVHEMLKNTCNYKTQVIESTGEEIKIGQSTASLKTIEFEEYLEKCRRKAFEFFNAIIPLPNEQLEIF